MAENRGTDGLLPTHIGIIMDGNGRWAQKRGLPRSAGHKQGARVFRNIVRYCREIGIGYLTVYAFSTENWKRPQSEIDAIMDLLRDYLDELERHGDEQQGTDHPQCQSAPAAPLFRAAGPVSGPLAGAAAGPGPAFLPGSVRRIVLFRHRNPSEPAALPASGAPNVHGDGRF